MRFLKFIKRYIYVPSIFFTILFFLTSYAVYTGLSLIVGFSIFSSIITVVITIIVEFIVFLFKK